MKRLLLVLAIVFLFACTRSDKYVVVKYSAETQPAIFVIEHGRTIIQAECGWTQGEDENGARIISYICEAPKIGEATDMRRFSNELHYETAKTVWVVLIVKAEERK